MHKGKEYWWPSNQKGFGGSDFRIACLEFKQCLFGIYVPSLADLAWSFSHRRRLTNSVTPRLLASRFPLDARCVCGNYASWWSWAFILLHTPVAPEGGFWPYLSGEERVAHSYYGHRHQVQRRGGRNLCFPELRCSRSRVLDDGAPVCAFFCLE